MRNIVCLMLLASSLTLTGCDVKQHMEEVGFKQGDTVLEKGTIKYDLLVDKDEDCNKAWSNVEANLQRRSDMIPQLVGVVKGAASHEETTLIAVAQARANATRPEIKLDEKSGAFESPEKMAQFQAAQGQLGATMSRLLVANENYPQVAALPAFHDLQIQIEGTENRLLRAREEYNDKVFEFNKELRHVSGRVINPATGWEFKPRIPFSADSDAKVAPKVDFSSPVK